MTEQELLLAHPNDPLHDHLQLVGEKAKRHTSAFCAAEQGEAAGLLHDVGKAESEFQERLRRESADGSDSRAKRRGNKGDGVGKKPHAHHGAMLALERGAWAVAFAVNGHHAGLHNRDDVKKRLDVFLPKAKEAIRKIEAQAKGSLDFDQMLSNLSDRPAWLQELEFNARRTSEGWYAFELFTRFLFSALIDADRLATEEIMSGEKSAFRVRNLLEFNADELRNKLWDALKTRAERAREEQNASDEVLALRREVGDLALTAAKQDRGLFSLTVPTGGGKTLASMLFALAHAAHHNARLSASERAFRRVIVVIPYLSIIEQTAKELKDVFGRDFVLEHHSLADDDEMPPGQQRSDKKTNSNEEQAGEPHYDSRSERRRLAVENWDAPIVVTTSVQFFSSLFSRRPSSARKLHNICQSVVIFDEVQTLPPLLLVPLLNVIRELSDAHRCYGCSVVFCTATQPAFEWTDEFTHGLKDIRHIVPLERAREHYKQLQRVDYDTRSLDEGVKKDWDTIAREIMATDKRQALCVVNTRKAARELHAKVKELMLERRDDLSGLFHLSTWMHPTHRRRVLDEVRRRLESKANERCLLISTQCIEAGVDVDFPEAWRAFAPYDSIVQAAGRCNRNGKIAKGVFHVFYPEDESAPHDGVYQSATTTTETLRKLGRFEPHDPETFNSYFSLLYQTVVPDACAIQRERAELHFKVVHETFKFIDDDTVPVLVLTEYSEGKPRDTPAKKTYERAQKRGGFFTLDEWRAIQQYVINLFRWDIQKYPGRLVPAFADTDRLLIWQGVYRGAVNDYGLDVQGQGLTTEEMQG
jgi:CRISPR-associated endonuclease/helicase Cas3